MSRYFAVIVLSFLFGCRSHVDERNVKNTQEADPIYQEFQQSFVSYLSFEGEIIEDFKMWNNSGESFEFTQFIGDQTVLCLYLPGNTCLDCVRKQLSVLASAEKSKR